MVYLFDVPAYFILLRETLEVTIILAVLLGFIDKLVPEKNLSLRRYLKRQIWIGTGLGLVISLAVGITFIVIFHTVAKNLWQENSSAWEGSFALVASIAITLMSLSMTRVQKWRGKWEKKLEESTENQLNKSKTGNKWALILLSFSVVCRESVETFIFLGGIGFDRPASDLPIPAILGFITGFFVGWILYKGSHKVSIHAFFVATTVLLLFIAAGLFSTAIYEFQEATNSEEVVLWKATCCDEDENEFWGIMESLFGWRSEATIGTTVGYFVYWKFVIIAILSMRYYDKKKAAKESKEKHLRGEVFDDKSVAEVADKTDANVVIDKIDGADDVV